MMKRKNKYVMLTCFALLLFTQFTGCGNRSVAQTQVDGTLDELMSKIYEGVEIDIPMTDTRELTTENAEYYLGTTDIPFTEGAASEALITTVPHSIVLFRVGSDADVETIKKKVKDSANPRKWICVMVDESNVVVDNIGNLIILIMDNHSAAYHESFLKFGA